MCVLPDRSGGEFAPERADRAVAAYIGLAIGDALGATVEFMTPREIRSNFGTHRRMVGGGWLKLRPGQVTDDTTMSLYLGEAILAEEGRVVAESVATAFDCWMRRRPVDIGNTVRRGILHYRRTGEAEVCAAPHDAGNGSCMRLLPVVLTDIDVADEVLARDVRTQGHTTHNNPLADAGSICIARMIRIAMNGGDKRDLLLPVQALVSDFPEFAFRARREENPSGFIVHTLRAVFQAFFDTDSFEQCLVDVVNRGGDADTTGAIAGMVAGGFYGSSAIPAHWVRALEPAVGEACTGQARALLACARQAGR
jgi:ADP-ribosyl-[dinitrogen reductase] hydrolase